VEVQIQVDGVEHKMNNASTIAHGANQSFSRGVPPASETYNVSYEGDDGEIVKLAYKPKYERGEIVINENGTVTETIMK